MPRGLLGVGSGDLAFVDTSWTLYLGGYSTTFRNRLYKATSQTTGPLENAEWRLSVDRLGRARPLVDDPPRKAWDGGGIHTPSYVPATASAPARIYYAGRSGRHHVGRASQYGIGVLEDIAGQWRRSGAPIMIGDADRSSVLEPRVVYENGRYVMWYLATPHEVAPGEQPDYELRCVTSSDGLAQWSEPVVFSTPLEGFFDVALDRTDTGWTMLLAAGTNLHRTSPYPAQGLWLMTASTASPHRSEWSEPLRILDTDTPGTPEWMGAGVCDPTIRTLADGGLTVFATGTRRYDSWAGLAAQRLRLRRGLPVPAPFYLATGVLTFN